MREGCGLGKEKIEEREEKGWLGVVRGEKCERSAEKVKECERGT